ncbi:hypothetical protein K5P26_06995 [Sphingopyxis sp. XHP0097]|jgi:hypothetical protein|uniref:Uncharacterized protein n=1 Tax=Sphingopyxis jiangsuensis TaxID=2871171 RepID=A0ABS7MCY4_9SPHN|nr:MULTISPECIES: hypothetical protein [Sphingopyxis]MBL0767455.1 hypothetical protein [Sphingopyxis lutea]MBY4636884.1 hypothetical protein [Sphingopyxis jiangsuensis]
MTSIELPDTMPPRHAAAPAKRRPAPCAGLFGWRKDMDGASPAPRADNTPGVEDR